MVSTTAKLSRVQERGQITIPLEFRRKLGIKKGDLVAFIETEEGILIRLQEVVAMMVLDQIGEMLRGKGITIDELIESGRKIRGDLIEEEYDLSEEKWQKEE